MLKKYTTTQIKVDTKECSRCGKKIAIAHVVAGKILCTKCKKEMADVEQKTSS